MRTPTKEEMEYVRAMVSDKRSLCWWCDNRPKNDTARECLMYIDWRETAAMERTYCKQFRLDFTRIGNTKEPEQWHRVGGKSEQLGIDFSGGGEA
jgi:hypothetical protein